MDSKGIIFTTDLLLALVIVTVAIGLASSQFENLNYQIQDFTGRQSLEKTVNDAADYLVKSSGNPNNWETQKPIPSNSLPGLAILNGNGYAQSQLVSGDKMAALNDTPSLIANLVNPGGNSGIVNYNLAVTLINSDGSSGATMFNKSSSNYLSLSSAKEVAVANRTAYLVLGKKIFSIFGIDHLDPGHPVLGQTYLWYDPGIGKPEAVYVGPGNTTGSSLPPSFTPDLITYDYWIVVTSPDNNGIPNINYALTGGDQVVNETYDDTKGKKGTPYSDPARYDNLNNIVRSHNSPYQWVAFPNNPSYGYEQNITSYLSYLQSINITYMKLWLYRGGSINKPLSIDVIAVPKGQTGITKSPVKLVLTIWQ